MKVLKTGFQLKEGNINDVARSYNTYIKRFPQNFLAGMFGFQAKPYFEADEGAEKAPDGYFLILSHHNMKASSFFSKEQQALILASVKEAEKDTSGEIRVHIETHVTEDVLDRAAWVFKKLEMEKQLSETAFCFILLSATGNLQ